MNPKIPSCVSIAGVDPSGGAGIAADLKTFSALGAYGCMVVTALTAQNTQAVTGIHSVPPGFIRQQIDTLCSDVRLDAAKTGMLATPAIVQEVAESLERWSIPWVVVDPVMVAKSGDDLLGKEALGLMREALFPQAHLITPNLPEAGALLNQRPPETVKEMYRAAEKLRELLPLSSARWVLLKGGHLPGNELTDLLFDGDRMVEFEGTRLPTRNTHGTGCTLASAVTALYPQFPVVEAAVRAARQWLTGAIQQADTLQIGQGHGPVHHFWQQWARPV